MRTGRCGQCISELESGPPGGQVCGQVCVPRAALVRLLRPWREAAGPRLAMAIPELVMKGSPVRVRASALVGSVAMHDLTPIPAGPRSRSTNLTQIGFDGTRVGSRRLTHEARGRCQVVTSRAVAEPEHRRGERTDGRPRYDHRGQPLPGPGREPFSRGDAEREWRLVDRWRTGPVSPTSGQGVVRESRGRRTGGGQTDR
jgi:hypothetical protein